MVQEYFVEIRPRNTEVIAQNNYWHAFMACGVFTDDVENRR